MCLMVYQSAAITCVIMQFVVSLVHKKKKDIFLILCYIVNYQKLEIIIQFSSINLIYKLVDYFKMVL